jgi:threonine 3-dehydrogenase
MGGGMAMLGIPSKPMETDWGAIILKALTIKGVYGREMFTTWRKMLGLLKAGLDLTPLITHQMGYERYQEGFEAMRSGQSGKVVLNWDRAACGDDRDGRPPHRDVSGRRGDGRSRPHRV